MNSNNTAVNADFNDLQIELFTIEERTFTTRLGYKVELLTEHGEFNSKIKIPDDTGVVKNFYFDNFNLLEDELKEQLKSFLYLSFTTLPAWQSKALPRCI